MEDKKAEYRIKYQKRKDYYKEYYQKHKDKMDMMSNNYQKKNRQEIKLLRKENKELKNELAECHGLMDEIDFWKREAKRLGWKPNLMEEDTIKELKDIGEF